MVEVALMPGVQRELREVAIVEVQRKQGRLELRGQFDRERRLARARASGDADDERLARRNGLTESIHESILDTAAIWGTNAVSRPVNCRSTRRPTSITSAWSITSPVTPAAMLVTSEIPRTSIPMWRATITSCTVDMPTRSAPSVRKARISAGVSKLGPST